MKNDKLYLKSVKLAIKIMEKAHERITDTQVRALADLLYYSAKVKAGEEPR